MKKFIFAMGSMILFSLSLLANDPTPTGDLSVFSLSPVGTIQEHPVYQLLLESEVNHSYQIVWKDADGTLLYEEYVSGKQIIRNYMIDLGDLGSSDVIIDVYDRVGKSLYTYRVSTDKIINGKN